MNGIQLASALRGKRVFFNGDSIVEQLLRAWTCDMRSLSSSQGMEARETERQLFHNPPHSQRRVDSSVASFTSGRVARELCNLKMTRFETNFLNSFV